MTSPSNLKTQYETVGTRAVQNVREWEATPGVKQEFVSCGRRFIKKYESAPLFVIGIEAEVLTSLLRELQGRAAEVFSNFRLPFPAMVFDFPEGPDTRQPDPCVMFVDTIAENRYYIEVLRTKESQAKRLERFTESDRAAGGVNEIPHGQELGEVVAIILDVDPLNPEQSHWCYSHEYVSDCQVHVEPNYDVPSYCTFSTCSPPGGTCGIKTMGCRALGQTADLVVIMLCVVLNYINRPDRYIVKETPEKTDREKRLAQKGKVPSFSKKERHVVLDHSQVKEIITAASGGSCGERGPVLPHQRRGHWRNLTADCFKEKKRVWVRDADINKGLKIAMKKCVYEVVS